MATRSSRPGASATAAAKAGRPSLATAAPPLPAADPGWAVLSIDELDTARDRLARDATPPDAMLDLCWQTEDEGRVRDAVALSLCAAELAAAAHHADAALDLSANAIRLLHALGELRGAVDYGQCALKWVRRGQGVLPRVRLLSTLGLVYAGLGRIDRAVECLRKAGTLPVSTSPEAAYLLAARRAETMQLLGLRGSAAAEWRKALGILRRMPARASNAYRQVCSRVTLSNVLLLAHVHEGEPVDMGEVGALLGEAGRYIGSVRSQDTHYTAACGLAAALQDGDAEGRWVEAFLALADEVVATEEGWAQAAVCAWATIEAVQHGRLDVARGLLGKIDPARAPLAWPSWAAVWHRAMGEVLAAAGDHAAAVAAYRAFAETDKRNRDHQVRMAFEMADLASRASEIQSREREASSRADRLARHNAALAAEKAQLAESALTDALTGLGNRRAMALRVTALRARRRAAHCTLVIGDIDHFKSINDRFSHQVGDRVLAAVGALFGGSTRKSDCAVRWGGEEFLILYGSPVGLQRLDALRRSVESRDWTTLAAGLAVTISLGAAPWTSSTDFDTALALADKRLYAAKRAGRNRVVCG